MSILISMTERDIYAVFKEWNRRAAEKGFIAEEPTKDNVDIYTERQAMAFVRIAAELSLGIRPEGEGGSDLWRKGR